MKKIYGFLIIILLSVSVNSVFGKNIKTEINPKKKGLIIYEQIAFHSLPNYLLNKNLDSSKILKIIKENERKILIKKIKHKKLKWSLPIKITNETYSLFANYSNATWSTKVKKFLFKPSVISWIITILLFIVIFCLFTISLIHQIKNKEKNHKHLIFFFIILYWEIILFGLIIPKIALSKFYFLFFSNTLIIMLLCLIGTFCFFPYIYFGLKSNKNVSSSLFLISILPMTILIQIISKLLNTPELITFMIGIACIFFFVNFIAYLILNNFDLNQKQ